MRSKWRQRMSHCSQTNTSERNVKLMLSIWYILIRLGFNIMTTNTLFLKQEQKNWLDMEIWKRYTREYPLFYNSPLDRAKHDTHGHISRQEQQILDRQRPSVFIHPADCLRIWFEGIKLFVVRWFDVRSENIITASEAKIQRVAVWPLTHAVISTLSQCLNRDNPRANLKGQTVK